MKDLQRFEELKKELAPHLHTNFIGDEYLQYDYEDYEKLIEAKFDDEIKYIGTNDFQQTNFFVGYVGTAKDWLENALSWCDSDENYECISMLVMNCDEQTALDEIMDIWEIKIERFDENNAEHIRLKKEYERY